ncbi:MAG TPA: alpha/beta hydrolase [Chloroflexota bacterium]|nr:alpha/beta hydrolase [Chloroflexota bacterium]
MAWSITERGLDRVACPVLILWRTQDRFLPLALAARFAASLPNDRVQLLPGCGHSLREDCPAESLPARYRARPAEARARVERKGEVEFSGCCRLVYVCAAGAC